MYVHKIYESSHTCIHMYDIACIIIPSISHQHHIPRAPIAVPHIPMSRTKSDHRPGRHEVRSRSHSHSSPFRIGHGEMYICSTLTAPSILYILQCIIVLVYTYELV